MHAKRIILQFKSDAGKSVLVIEVQPEDEMAMPYLILSALECGLPVMLDAVPTFYTNPDTGNTGARVLLKEPIEQDPDTQAQWTVKLMHAYEENLRTLDGEKPTHH